MSQTPLEKLGSSSEAQPIFVKADDRQSPNPAPVLAAIAYRVQQHDTYARLLSVIRETTAHGEGSDPLRGRSTNGLVCALRDWLETHHQLGLGGSLDAMVGHTIWLPSATCVLGRYATLRALGKLPDAVSHPSSELSSTRHILGAALVNEAPPLAHHSWYQRPRASSRSAVRAGNSTWLGHTSNELKLANASTPTIAASSSNTAVTPVQTLVTRITEALASIAAQRGQPITGVTLWAAMQRLSVSPVELRDAFASMKSIDDVTNVIAVALDMAAAPHGLKPDADAAATLTRQLAASVSFMLAVVPVARMLRAEVTRGITALTPLLESVELRQEQARLLAGLDPEQARRRLAMMGLAVNAAQITANIRGGVAHCEKLIESLAAEGLLRLTRLDQALQGAEAMRGRLEIFKLCPEITRLALATREIGINPADFPFKGAKPGNAAQEALFHCINTWDRGSEKWLVWPTSVAIGLVSGGLGLGLVGTVASVATSSTTSLLGGVRRADQLQSLADRGWADIDDAQDMRGKVWLSIGVKALSVIVGAKAIAPLAKSALGGISNAAVAEAVSNLLKKVGMRLVAHGIENGLNHLLEEFSAARQRLVDEAYKSLQTLRSKLEAIWHRVSGEIHEAAHAAFEQCLRLFARLYQPALARGMEAAQVAQEFEAFARELVMVGKAVDDKR